MTQLTAAEIAINRGPHANAPRRFSRWSYYVREDVLTAYKISSAHLDLLIEAGEVKAGAEYRGKIAWHMYDVEHQMGRMMTVYFVALHDFVKIGFTRRLSDRLTGFATSLPYPVTLLHSIAGSVAVEQCLHRRFAHLRERGEWFRSAPDLLACIDALRAPQ